MGKWKWVAFPAAVVYVVFALATLTFSLQEWGNIDASLWLDWLQIFTALAAFGAVIYALLQSNKALEGSNDMLGQTKRLVEAFTQPTEAVLEFNHTQGTKIKFLNVKARALAGLGSLGYFHISIRLYIDSNTDVTTTFHDGPAQGNYSGWESSAKKEFYQIFATWLKQDLKPGDTKDIVGIIFASDVEIFTAEWTVKHQHGPDTEGAYRFPTTLKA